MQNQNSAIPAESSAESSSDETKRENKWAPVKVWWEKLNEPSNSGNRATLRRAQCPDQVAMEFYYLDLYKKMKDSDLSDYEKHILAYRLPIVAGLLSHVKEHESRTMPQSMSNGGDEAVSDLRFRRLIRTDDPDKLYIVMIRIVRMLKNKVNVLDLAESVFNWNARIKKRWVSEYYLNRDIYSNKTNQGEN